MPGISRIEFSVAPGFVDIIFTIGAVCAGKVAVFGSFENDLFDFRKVFFDGAEIDSSMEVDIPGRLKKAVSLQEPEFFVLILKFMIRITSDSGDIDVVIGGK